MSLWRQLTRGVRVLTDRSAADQDVRDEVQHYLDEATAAHAARGLAPDDARRAARLETGNLTGVRETVRSYGWENLPGTLISDLRYAVRRLRNSPGFTALAVLTLALGIGATTAIFSAVNPVLFQPLPYPGAARIVTLWDRGTDGSRVAVTFGSYRELAERSRSFDAIAVMKSWQPTMTGAAEPVRFDGQRVSSNYFRALGVAPALGRDLSAADDVANGPDVVILSDAVWRQRFGMDRAIIGRQVRLDDHNYTVIGVMPPTFENVLAPSAGLWTPLQYDPALPPDGREWGHHLRMVGRLRAGIDIDRARRELDAIARRPVPEFARARWAMLAQGLTVQSLQADVTAGVRPALLAILGAAILVLLIACVNVTNLLLSRAAQRRGEFAVRAALGAGRQRIIRQLLTESVLLATIAGLVGVGIAIAGTRALVAISPLALPRLAAVGVDGSAFVFALALTGAVGIAFGLVPALHAARSDLHAGLQDGTRRTAGSQRLTRNTLVVAEVALALVLLVASGLLLRSMQRLLSIAPGFDAAHLLTMEVQTSGRRFEDDAVTKRFFGQSLEAVRQVPGVAAAAYTSQLPLSGDADQYGVQFESDNNPGEDHSAFRYAVSPGYFATMGIRLREGRALDTRDVAGAPGSVVINESLARRKFPGRTAIGQRLHIGPTDRAWYTIVGVAADVKQLSLALAPADAVYLTPEQSWFADNAMSLVVRARGDAAMLAAPVQRAVWSADKDQPIVRIATMDQLVATSAAERRFAMILFTAFALVALVLAAAGIYGVLSGSVTERTREIGVRSALGASRGEIVGLIARQGMTLTGLGAAVGLAGAFAATQGIVTLLFGVSRLDPFTYAGVIVVLVGVSATACAVPAWRAARVDPAIALRGDD